MSKIQRCFIVAFALLFFVSSCSYNEDEITLIYKEKEYKSVLYWYPVSNDYKNIKVNINDKSQNAFLYSESGHNSIKTEGSFMGEMYFFPENEKMPDFKKADNINKMVISRFSGEEIIINNTVEIKNWVKTISNAPKCDKSKDNVVGSIDIYYSNFPAFQYLGNLWKNQNGEFTVEFN